MQLDVEDTTRFDSVSYTFYTGGGHLTLMQNGWGALYTIGVKCPGVHST